MQAVSSINSLSNNVRCQYSLFIICDYKFYIPNVMQCIDLFIIPQVVLIKIVGGTLSISMILSILIQPFFVQNDKFLNEFNS
jgi:D-ribose pyranose/furanose isomerase RbsD